MDTEVLVAILTPLLAFGGTLLGAVTNNKLQKYRISALEGEVKQNEKKCADLEKNLNKENVDIETMKKDIAFLRNEINELKTTINELKKFHMK